MKDKTKITVGILLSSTITLLSFIISYLTSTSVGENQGVIMEYLMLAFTIPILYYFHHKGIIRFKMSSLKLTILLKIIVISYIVSILTQFLSGLTMLIFERPANQNPTISNTYIYIINILIVASLAEELLFRGFLLNMLQSLREKSVKIFRLHLSYSAILSGFVFGAIHLIYLIYKEHLALIVLMSISASIMGTLAGYFQEKYENNTLAAIVTTISSNFVSVVGILIALQS